jgi:hypothetical protein
MGARHERWYRKLDRHAGIGDNDRRIGSMSDMARKDAGDRPDAASPAASAARRRADAANIAAVDST